MWFSAVHIGDDGSNTLGWHIAIMEMVNVFQYFLIFVFVAAHLLYHPRCFCERVVMFRAYLLDHNLSRVLLTICFNVLKLHVNLAPSLLAKLVTDSLPARLEVGPMT